MCEEYSFVRNPDRFDAKPLKKPEAKLFFPRLYFSDSRET
jgi:hypothetical protein